MNRSWEPCWGYPWARSRPPAGAENKPGKAPAEPTGISEEVRVTGSGLTTDPNQLQQRPTRPAAVSG